MEFALLAASILAVLGWFVAYWKGLDSWCWHEHSKRIEAELERVCETLVKCRRERDLLARECQADESKRVA